MHRIDEAMRELFAAVEEASSQRIADNLKISEAMQGSTVPKTLDGLILLVESLKDAITRHKAELANAIAGSRVEIPDNPTMRAAETLAVLVHGDHVARRTLLRERGWVLNEMGWRHADGGIFGELEAMTAQMKIDSEPFKKLIDWRKPKVA